LLPVSAGMPGSVRSRVNTSRQNNANVINSLARSGGLTRRRQADPVQCYIITPPRYPFGRRCVGATGQHTSGQPLSTKTQNTDPLKKFLIFFAKGIAEYVYLSYYHRKSQ
jgi:hypothetical protein